MQSQKSDIVDPNAHLAISPTWVFQLGKRDTLLVLKALRGRLTDEDEVSAARELGDRLTRLRAAAGRDLLSNLESAEAAANGDRKIAGRKT
jgi:hypothetical protein